MFSSLNRYAKKTDRDTDIIMDEDDAFAILTRRLITDFQFFRDETNRQSVSSLVKMKGSNLNAKDVHFTTLQTLYAMNTELLRTQEREKDKRWRNNKMFILDRPEEEELDKWYEELAAYWEAILKALPDLLRKPQDMRHSAGNASKKEHLFFRPIGQKMMARLVRELLDDAFPAGYKPGNDMAKALKPLGKIDWDILIFPWRGLVSVPGADGEEFVMREEQREKALQVAQRIAKAMITVRGVKEDVLRKEWEKYLNPHPGGEKEVMKLWNKEIKPQLKF